MLVLTRKTSDVLLIGEARVKVLGLSRGVVKLGIEAPQHVSVVREEAKCKEERNGRKQ